MIKKNTFLEAHVTSKLLQTAGNISTIACINVCFFFKNAGEISQIADLEVLRILSRKCTLQTKMLPKVNLKVKVSMLRSLPQNVLALGGVDGDSLIDGLSVTSANNH